MSSRELLELVEEFPETSKFKEARDRTYRLVEYKGPDPKLKGKLLITAAHGPLLPDTVLVAEYVDWTLDRKIAARIAREIAAMRADGRDYQPDFTGLVEPLEAILRAREAKAKADRRAAVKARIRADLYDE